MAFPSIFINEIERLVFDAEQMLKPGEEAVKTVISFEAAGRTDEAAVFTK